MVSVKTRDLIKKNALMLFANNGYNETSIEKISAGAGIKKSSLYSFFSSKEALFWEIYEDLERAYYNYMEQLLVESAGESPTQRLYYLFRQYLNCTEMESESTGAVARTFWSRVLFFPPVELKERLLARALKRELEFCKRYKEIVEEGIRQGTIRNASAEEILLTYYSLRQGLYSLMNVFMPDLTEEQRLQRIDQVWQNYYQGIKGRQ